MAGVYLALSSFIKRGSPPSIYDVVHPDYSAPTKMTHASSVRRRVVSTMVEKRQISSLLKAITYSGRTSADALFEIIFGG
jgi:hypothetical protein